mmetsp:Transcript_9412/g.22194  ORF Transcript_9412/g.22194 Transcript_9412/m.22194 type:complete len:313 (+) Transcript_9412:381-1319(+)
MKSTASMGQSFTTHSAACNSRKPCCTNSSRLLGMPVTASACARKTQVYTEKYSIAKAKALRIAVDVGGVGLPSGARINSTLTMTPAQPQHVMSNVRHRAPKTSFSAVDMAPRPCRLDVPCGSEGLSGPSGLGLPPACKSGPIRMPQALARKMSNVWADTATAHSKKKSSAQGCGLPDLGSSWRARILAVMNNKQSMEAGLLAWAQTWKHCSQRATNLCAPLTWPSRLVRVTPVPESSRQLRKMAWKRWTMKNKPVSHMVQSMAALTGGAYSVSAVVGSSQRSEGRTPRLRVSMVTTWTHTTDAPKYKPATAT